MIGKKLQKALGLAVGPSLFLHRLHPPGCRGLTLVFSWKNCYNNLNLEHSAQTVRI